MYTDITMRRLIISLSVLGLLSCSATEKIAKEEGSIGTALFNNDGRLVVVNTKTGKRVPSCAEREQDKSLTSCKSPFNFEDGEVYHKQLDKNVQVIKQGKLTFYRYKGSVCETYYSDGIEFEICY